MPTTVRARFYVSELKRNAYNPDHVTVTLNAVSRGEENKAWAYATPSGSLTMVIANPAASAVFAEALGKEFFLDITPAPEP